MADGGGDNPTSTAYSVDEASLSQFIKSGQGAQYASQYTPGNTYYQISDGSYFTQGKDNSQGGYVTEMMNAYNSWKTGQNQSQANWQNYANIVNANEGGQNDNTITTGPAVSQRNDLLGALANAGNPTTPTPGLGTFGVSAALGAKQLGTGSRQ